MRVKGSEFAQPVRWLAEHDCLELLAGCRTASLACIERARPTVVPVDVAVVGSQLRVALPPGTEAGRLVGQLVALGAAVPAAPGGVGWWVVVRGTLLDLPGEQVLLLETSEIEGRVLAAPAHWRWRPC